MPAYNREILTIKSNLRRSERSDFQIQNDPFADLTPSRSTASKRSNEMIYRVAISMQSSIPIYGCHIERIQNKRVKYKIFLIKTWIFENIFIWNLITLINL